ncbi:MAG: hypothetical protein M3Q96_06835, partial [Pseudomonadota bacterium]|nr:hypothetical protein [Pseudomonadota bacterium]
MPFWLASAPLIEAYMPIGLLLAHQLDPVARPRLNLAAERAGVTLRTWESGHNLRTGEPAPTFIVA